MTPFPYIKYGLTFRLVDDLDAEFILKLRTDEKKSKYLSLTTSELDSQKIWIRAYKEREKRGEEYYIICTCPNKGLRYGVNRIYNITPKGFEIGSWLFDSGLEIYIPIVGDLEARSFAFEFLKSDFCVFNVRKNNKNVLRYHIGFKPEIISEDEENIYFKLSRELFFKHKNTLLKILGYENENA